MGNYADKRKTSLFVFFVVALAVLVTVSVVKAATTIGTGISTTGSTSLVDLYASGNVGIGTTTPRATLHVNGEIMPGSTGAVCGSNNRGSISFSVADGLRICLDSGWSLLSAPSASSSPLGYWPDLDSNALISRIPERIFIGNAVNYSGLFEPSTTTYDWLRFNNYKGARWLPRESQLHAESNFGRIGVLGTSFSSMSPSYPHEVASFQNSSIGVAGFARNDRVYDLAVSKNINTWGGYFESVREQGSGAAFGAEIDVGNRGTSSTSTPFHLFGVGAYGLNVAAGGSYRGTGTNTPSSAGITIANNTNSTCGFNSGLIFGKDSLCGTNGSDDGSASAILMAKNHTISWFTPEGGDGLLGASIISKVDENSKRTGLSFNENYVTFTNATSTILSVEAVAGSVNYVKTLAQTAGFGPELAVSGADSDIDLILRPKGTGDLISTGNIGVGTTSAAATLDVNGYMRLKKNTVVPVACGTANAGSIALDSHYWLCICNGTNWVYATSSAVVSAW